MINKRVEIMSKEYKNLRVDAEIFKALEKYKLDNKVSTYTDALKKLLGHEVEAKAIKKLPIEDTVPRLVIEIIIVECLIANPKSFRERLVGYVATRLIELGWDKARPKYLSDKTWRAPLVIAIDNCIYRLAQSGIIEAVGIPRIKQYILSDRFDDLIKNAPDSTNKLIESVLPDVILKSDNPYSHRLMDTDLL